MCAWPPPTLPCLAHPQQVTAKVPCLHLLALGSSAVQHVQRGADCLLGRGVYGDE